MRFNTCIITSVLPPNIKGVQILVDNFIEIMEPISDTIYLIAGNYHEDISKHKFNLINLKMDDKKYSVFIKILNFIVMQFKMSYELLKIRNNVDIVIFFISTPFIIPMLISKAINKKTIIIATGSSSRGSKQSYKDFKIKSKLFSEVLKFLEKSNYHFSDCIVVISSKLVKELDLEKYKEKINYACATFVDTDHFSVENDLKDRNNTIGFIGRLTETKGILQFVKSIKILSKNNNFNFFIGGDGHLREEVEKELLKTDLKKLVTFKGWISHDDLPQYLNTLKLIVIPSYTEAFPAIALEAMACGTPVLITPVGGVRDIIDDGENGFIMEDNSPELIAKNIQRVLNYPNLGYVATNARIFLENNFSQGQITKNYEMIIKSKD